MSIDEIGGLCGSDLFNIINKLKLGINGLAINIEEKCSSGTFNQIDIKSFVISYNNILNKPIDNKEKTIFNVLEDYTKSNTLSLGQKKK